MTLATATLGRTGFKVSRIGFGAWAIGGRGYGDVPEEDAVASLEAYLDAGGNFIDTASRYGESERIIGAVLQGRSDRERILLASKTPGIDAPKIREDTETSLRRLQTETIDLHYLHSPPADPGEMNRALDVMEALKREGKIRAIGASIKGPDVTPDTVDLCRQYIASGRVDAIQLIFSIFRQRHRPILREAEAQGVGIVGRTVLESGFLTGKYQPGHRFPEGDHRRRWGEKLDAILAEVQALPERVVAPPYQSLAEVAIRFALDQPGMSTVILGAKTVVQTQANLKALDRPPLSETVRQYLVDTFGDRTDEFNI